jgi:hypothetical protein
MTRLPTAGTSVVRRQSRAQLAQSETVQIVQLPVSSVRPTSVADPRQLSQVLFETAGLLAESIESGDPEFRDEVIELAVRSLRVAGTVIERRLESPSAQVPGL